MASSWRHPPHLNEEIQRMTETPFTPRKAPKRKAAPAYRPQAASAQQAPNHSPSPKVANVDADTFAMLVHSLYNLTNELTVITRDVTETKQMVWQVAENQQAMGADIATIANAVGVGRGHPGFRQAAPVGGAPSGDRLREAMASIPQIPNSGQRSPFRPGPQGQAFAQTQPQEDEDSPMDLRTGRPLGT